MTDLVLTFTPYAVAIVVGVVIFGSLIYAAVTWHRPDPRPGYLPIYDRDKERLPL